jgi:hypothetical protein
LLASRGYQARIDIVSRKFLQIPFARRRGNGPQQVLLLAHDVGAYIGNGGLSRKFCHASVKIGSQLNILFRTLAYQVSVV